MIGFAIPALYKAVKGGGGGGGGATANNDLLNSFFSGQQANQGWRPGGGAFPDAGGFRAPAPQQGAATIPGVANQNLMDILMSGGATDPRLMNQQVAGIDRGTQGAQMTARGNLAAGGLQGSRLGEALQAAIGQAGEERQAGLQADEAQRMEQRKRDDLALFLQVYLQPMLEQYAIKTGQYQANKDRSSQTLMSFINTLGTAYGAYRGAQ